MFLPFNRTASVGNFKAPSAPTADVTPNAVDWANVSAAIPTTVITTSTQTITGIDASITLLISVARTAGQTTPSYSKNGGAFTNIARLGATTTTGSVSISISNNDTLAFRSTVPTTGGSVNFTVTNTTDNSTVLDTFSMNVT